MGSPLSNPRRVLYEKTYSLLSDHSLSYNDYTKGFILPHLCDLTSRAFNIDPVIMEDKSGNLLKANVSFHYTKMEYNVYFPRGKEVIYPITVMIYFKDSYPHCCPHVHLSPINFGDVVLYDNKLVSPSGEISHPYLLNWNHSQSNLTLLFSALRDEFARNPPIVSVFNTNEKVLTNDEIKFVNVLISNGHLDIYRRLWGLDEEKLRDFFKKVASRYRKHPNLDIFIKSTEEQLTRFITIVKESLPPDASKKNVDRVSSPTTLVKHNFVCPQQISPINQELSSLTSLTTLHYEDSDRSCIYQHLCDLKSFYPSLISKAVANLIEVSGSIVYSFNGTYFHNVSVIIRLRKGYPVTRPHVFVYCASKGKVSSCGGLPILSEEMCIKEDLLSVSSNGYVCCSYLREWLASKSNLTGFVSHLSALFSCQPPSMSKVQESSSRNTMHPSVPPSQGVLLQHRSLRDRQWIRKRK